MYTNYALCKCNVSQFLPYRGHQILEPYHIFPFPCFDFYIFFYVKYFNGHIVGEIFEYIK